MFFHEFDDSAVWIRNCIHLLTANSPGVKKIEQHMFVFGSSPSRGLFHVRFPRNLFFHRNILHHLDCHFRISSFSPPGPSGSFMGQRISTRPSGAHTARNPIPMVNRERIYPPQDLNSGLNRTSSGKARPCCTRIAVI